jgi:hypothetical protein
MTLLACKNNIAFVHFQYPIAALLQNFLLSGTLLVKLNYFFEGYRHTKNRSFQTIELTDLSPPAPTVVF